MELAEIFFSQKSVIARGRSVTPFFWAKHPLSPHPKKTASAAKPILACLYKTLTMGARCSCGQLSYFEKPCVLCLKFGGACMTYYLVVPRYEKRDEKSDSHSAKKGRDKLVSSNYTKLLE